MLEVKRPMVVLKFGSSVLKDRDSLPEVVSEIYRAVRRGRRVVAVVSAFAGVTDTLVEDTLRTGCPHDNINAPAYIVTGEETAAALVALACDRSGLCAIALKTAELGIEAEGPMDEACPVRLRTGLLSQALETHDVVVVPGFVANNGAGRTVLLGRGGSDLTAVFLADALCAERVRLVKDVDGVYDRDPAQGEGALRFERIDWATAKSVAGRLVQVRALEFARVREIPVEVGAIGIDEATVIGRSAAAPVFHYPPPKLRVALAGYGVVGAGVAARLLHRPQAFEVVGVLVRNPRKPREESLPTALLTSSISKLLERQPDVVVDALSCALTSAHLIEEALRRRLRIVSANKQAVAALLASPGARTPDARGRLLYSAAVGGAAPLLETILQARGTGAEITAIEGVFNGTVNYILEQLAAGADFEAAIAQAQRAGLAEEDPTADLSGNDAAAKLHIVSKAAFDGIPRTADLTLIALDRRVAAEARRTRFKQIARVRSENRRLFGTVSFEPADGGPFIGLTGDRNAIRVVAKDGRVWTARGRGAGRWPTTESVFADLVDLHALNPLPNNVCVAA